MSATLTKLLEERLGNDLLEASSFRSFETALVRAGAFADAIRILKTDGGLSMLSDLCGADYPGREEPVILPKLLTPSIVLEALEK